MDAMVNPRKQLQLSLECGTWSLFGNGLLLGLLMFLVIPAGWGMAMFYGWFFSQLRVSDGSSVRFKGTGGQIALVAIIYMLIIYAYQVINAFNKDPGTMFFHIFVYMLALSIVQLFLVRWMFRSIEFRDRQSLVFRGDMLSLIGWNLLCLISMVTIIGWAWAGVGFIRWMLRKVEDVEDNSLRLAFIGSGGSFLWRTLVTAICCCLIIPIPWMLKWFWQWYVSMIVIDLDEHVAAPATEPQPVEI